jgi:hypothetical protein
MQHYAKYYDRFKYLLAVVDVFSRYGWMRALKSKSGIEVAIAFKDIIDSSGHKPELVWSDKGKEFYNQHVKSVVTIYSTENEEKSSIVEWWKRTTKAIMFKYFTANNTYRYIDVIQEMIYRCDNSKHRSVKLTPVLASIPEHESKVYMNLYDDIIHDRSPKPTPNYAVGDTV